MHNLLIVGEATTAVPIREGKGSWLFLF